MDNSDNSYKSLYVFGGIGAGVALIANVLDIVLGFGSTEFVMYGSKSALEYFALFGQSWFKGIYTLGILNIVYMLAMLPVYFALVVAHRKKHLVYGMMAATLFLVAMAIYLTNNAAIPMLVLANKYVAAETSTQQQLITAAAEAVLATGEDFTPGAFISLFLSSLAAISISLIMFTGNIFGKIHSVIGLIGFSFLTLFTIFATFVPSLYTFSFYFFGSIGGMLALVWFGLTCYKLFKLK